MNINLIRNFILKRKSSNIIRMCDLTEGLVSIEILNK